MPLSLSIIELVLIVLIWTIPLGAAVALGWYLRGRTIPSAPSSTERAVLRQRRWNPGNLLDPITADERSFHLEEKKKKLLAIQMKED